MPIETLDDIIESIANGLRVYGAHQEGEERQCRICFTVDLKARIMEAVRIEQKLYD